MNVNWRTRIERDALRLYASTTLEQMRDILENVIEDVMLDDAGIARRRGLEALANVLAQRAERLAI